MDNRSNQRFSKVSIVLAVLLIVGVGGITWFSYQLFGNNNSDSEPISNLTLNISVEETGIYAIHADEVSGASNLASIDWALQPVSLTLQGEPVPYQVREKHLVFFGREQESVYSRHRVYQLHFGDRATIEAVEFPTINGSPQDLQNPMPTVTRLADFEQNLRYVSVAREDEWLDTWYWDQIHVSDYFEFEADLPHIADGSLTIKSHLFGVSHDSKTENDHDLDVVINDQILGQILFDGNQHVIAEVSLPSNSIKSGNNLIQFDNRPEGNTFIDITEVDWVQIAYASDPVAVDDSIRFITQPGTVEISRLSAEPLIFALTEKGNPILVQNASYKNRKAAFTLNSAVEIYAAGPNGWLSPSSILPAADQIAAISPAQTDFIIIAHADFEAALAPLVSARQAQGLSVKVVNTETIYNQFGYGEASPFAIQAFLADAIENWPKPAPRYLLLAGGTTYDFKQNQVTAEQNRVPSLMVPVEHSGETVSDTQLADIDGDGRANFSVGRWPATSVEEISSLVERTLAYEQQAAAESTLFTADGTSGEFSYASDRLINLTQLNNASLHRAYGSSWEQVADYWNKGNWVVTYVGHGSVDLWGSDEVLSSERIPILENPLGIAPPIVLQFTCLTGYFAHPEQRSISEQMLLSANGPVLTVSASSLTYSSSQEPFAEGILMGLTNPEFERIGDVVSEAREALDITNPSIKEVYDTFNLLGDPSAKVIRP